MAVAGVVLLVLGALLIASEVHAPTHGISGTVGTAVLAVGMVLALAAAGAGVAIGLGAGLLVAAGGGGAVAFTVTRSGALRRRRVHGGAQGLIGEIGTVRAWSHDEGSVTLQGAVWKARRSPCADESTDEAATELHVGDPVVVERLVGLTVSVRPAEEWELMP